MKNNAIKAMLDEKEDLRALLFPRGFLMTNDSQIEKEQYPFYGMWNWESVCGYSFLVHPKQKLHLSKQDDLTLALVGHAFDPVSSESEYSEEKMLETARLLYKKDSDEFERYFNQWTGLFALFIFEEGTFRVYGDAAGMYTVFYGTHNGKIYCASHTNLLGDVCGLSFDAYINRLINYRFYSLFGKALPGDLSPYKAFKRLIPNHFAQYHKDGWCVTRFFPKEGNALLDVPYDALIDTAAQILSQSMKLIHKKWDRAAVSMTGGCDSKTTLSCTNGVYDQYTYFSYTSSDSENVDAEAARDICKLLNIPHRIYTISQRDEDYQDIESLRVIMEYNSGSIGKNNANDVRKRAFFLGIDDFDVEVKSWVSEVGRAYYHKRFAKKRFPKKLTPRYATCLYKVFLTDRKLVKETNLVFAEYLQKYYSDDSFERIPWYDLFFWEFRMSSWNGLVITGEQQIAYDIAIPYNNRMLLQALLSMPVEKRIKDEPHWDIMKKMNPEIADCNISVVNVKHTNRRAKLERLYLEVCSRIPF